jgi:hypothetical protein
MASLTKMMHSLTQKMHSGPPQHQQGTLDQACVDHSLSGTFPHSRLSLMLKQPLVIRRPSDNLSISIYLRLRWHLRRLLSMPMQNRLFSDIIRLIMGIHKERGINLILGLGPISLIARNSQISEVPGLLATLPTIPIPYPHYVLPPRRYISETHLHT